MAELAAADGALAFAPAVLGVALLLLLIAGLRLHALLSLTLAALVTGVLARMSLDGAFASYAKGFGDTAANVGFLIALGAVFARLLADSGASDVLVDRLLASVPPRAVPVAMAAVSALIGLPMFFEIGLLLLMPLISLVAARSGLSLLRVGIPALAALSAMHGLVPPHPGPLLAVQTLGADLGLTLALGVLVALPAIALAGPGFVRLTRADERPALAPVHVERTDEQTAARPTFLWALTLMLLPVTLMMAKALAELIPLPAWLRTFLTYTGRPFSALLLSVLIALLSLRHGRSRAFLTSSVERALPSTAGIFLVVAAGGGFKQTLVDTGLAQLASTALSSTSLSPLVLGWLLAVLVRLATGSATVATITASGVLSHAVSHLLPLERSLLVLAIGSGSLFFSHVNDAGFWLVKESFGLSVADTLKTWSILETVLSIAGLSFALLLQLAL